MSTLYLNIGSNSGDRRAFIARAVAALPCVLKPWFAGMRVSTEVESEPWGYESAARFINVGVKIELHHCGVWTAAELERLLSVLKELERSISAMPHRDAGGGYSDRELDIDIIALDDVRYKSESLEIPHPHMAARSFVLAPMAELAPEWRHPATMLTAAEMLCQDYSR